jgi:hypothetical protein
MQTAKEEEDAKNMDSSTTGNDLFHQALPFAIWMVELASDAKSGGNKGHSLQEKE